MGVRRMIATALTVLALTLVTGCSGAVPDGPPSIRGTITSVSFSQAGVGSILVEGPVADGTTLDKAALSINGDTSIIDASNSPLDAGDLETGMRVEAWITGPVRESYPVQADADTVRVIGSR